MLTTPEQPVGSEAALQSEERVEFRVRSDELESELTVERALRERAQRTADLLWRLQSLTADFARAKTTDDVADAVVDAGLVALDAMSGALALLNDEGTQLKIVRSAGFQTEVVDEWGSFAVSDELPLSEAVRKRELVLLESQEDRDRRYPLLEGIPTLNNSFACVPLVVEDRVLGGLSYNFRTSRTFSDDERSFLLALGQLTAQALERARLYEAEHEALERARKAEAEVHLNVAMLRAQGEATLDGVVVTDLDRKVVFHNQRMIDLFELDETQLDHWPEPSIFAPRLVDPKGFQERISELTSDERSFGRDRLAFLDGRVFDRWTAPLVDEIGEVRGRGWYYRDVTAERRAEEALEDGRRRASFLAEAGGALASTMDHRLLLERLADVATEWFADWCAVDLVQRDGTIERVVISSGDDEHLSSARRLDALRHYPVDPEAMEGVRRVIESGQWDMRDRIEDEWLVREARGNEDYLALLRGLQLRAHLCVPLQVGDRVIGAITFVTTGDGRVFTPADLALAQELAFRTAQAVEHARLYQEHTHISETLQRSLLPPHLPEIPGVEVAARYHASGDGYEVGGDFYDLFKTARGDWAIVLGDVCGKGADAAATTALARHTLRAAATQTKKPHRILQILNEAMLRAEQPFCTVAYARLHRTTDAAQITVAVGGHPLPIIVGADSTIETIGKPGTLLGCFPEPLIKEESRDLKPGDTIVLYTDGVTEARSQGNVLGDSGLRAALVRAAGCSADEVADSVLEAALDFQDGDARDDIAIVVLKIV